MLTVYTYPIPKPDDCYDVSKLSLEDGFLETIRSIIEHQKGGTIWFGYLEGWMLTPPIPPLEALSSAEVAGER